MNSAKLPLIKGGGDDRSLSRSYSLRTFARLSNFDAMRFLIRPSLRVVKATYSVPFFAAVVEREGLFCYVFVSFRFDFLLGSSRFVHYDSEHLV